MKHKQIRRAAAEVMGEPHARGISWRSCLGTVQPHRLRERPHRGVVESPAPDLALDHSPSHRRIFSLASDYFGGWAEAAGIGRPGEASRSTGASARSSTPPPRSTGLACPIRAQSWAGFRITRRVRISGRLFSHFLDSFRQAVIYKGTMGTREQAISDRQKTAPLAGLCLFPSQRTISGTWEHVWPIPMQENPRACGHPVPPPAGERH